VYRTLLVAIENTSKTNIGVSTKAGQLQPMSRSVSERFAFRLFFFSLQGESLQLAVRWDR
jgi:hypothetical protein